MSTKRYTLEGPCESPVDLAGVRLLYASSARYSGEWHSTLHSHTCSEFFYMVSGSGRFQIDDLLLPVYPADLMIVNPSVQHTELSSDTQSPLEYIVLGVDGLELGADEDRDYRYNLMHCQDCQEMILRDLREILRELELQQPGCQFICQGLLNNLIVRLTRRSDRLFVPAAGKKPSRECAEVRRYIDSHFKENITLDQLAKMAHVNKYYMVHTFSKAYGISPINYLISRRIAESKYLLADTNHSLSQISHMIGFSSPSYFSQSFRRLEQISPMEYRKAARSQTEPG